MWYSPFHALTVREVEYLVRGIAEVYGEEVDEELLQQQQDLQGNTGMLVLQVGLPAVRAGYQGQQLDCNTRMFADLCSSHGVLAFRLMCAFVHTPVVPLQTAFCVGT